MEQAVEMRAQLKAVAGAESPLPSFNDMIVKACALALREFPRANGAYRDGRFELYARVNVGVAVAGQDSLVVPVVFDADRKTLGEIARETRALAERVREGTVTPPELSGATFTVSNLGMYGVSNFTAIVNPPQAAILAVGALARRAVVHEDELAARHTMAVTLACDHRILYGADAAEFLGRIRTLLEQPAALAL
jgi:pyruvate dehydrogenase E2 component (dihydrolipoamide acetyltransferase)